MTSETETSAPLTPELIRRRLAEIERENGVRVLFAAESGSRAWGFSSPDSDWDVRFVYVHPLEWYLKVNAGRDTIESVGDDGLFDASGWELRKALGLFLKSNMALAEWMNSPVIYADDGRLRPALLALLPCCFDKTRALYHYYHIAVNHNRRYFETRGVELKRFLYYLRALLACSWIGNRGTPPPVPFSELAESEVGDSDIRREMERIVELKRSGREHNKAAVPQRLLDYGSRLEERVRRMTDETVQTAGPCPDREEKLDRLLYDTITAGS